MTNQRPDVVGTQATRAAGGDGRARPIRVSRAVSFLWISIALSAIGLVINLWILVPSAAPVGLALGVFVLGLKGLIVRFIAAGSNVARILLLVVVVLGIPGLAVVSTQTFSNLGASLLVTLVSMVLQISALYLLFTGESKTWFTVVRGV